LLHRRSPVKIVVFGDQGSGKTNILRRLIKQASSPTYKPTVCTEVHNHTLSNSKTRLTFWDCSGNWRQNDFVKGAQIGSHVGLYCIDLSKEIDIHTIENNIETYNKIACSSRSLILIATHADESQASEEKLNHLQNNLISGFKKLIATSAKADQGHEELETFVFAECEAHSKRINQISMWEQAVIKLKEDLQREKDGVPLFTQSTQTKVLKALEKLTLTINLSAPNLDIKKRAIEEFVTKCRPLLPNEPPHIMTRVLSVATVALVTLIGAAVGFVIGSFAGGVGGPFGSLAIGLFVGFLVGCAAANSVENFCNTHGFFAGGKRCKPSLTSAEMNPIDEFKASI